MKKFLWKLLKFIDNNHGYTTPIQERFNIGDKCKISHHINTDEIPFKIGEEVVILETGRHDYLVADSNGKKACLYQFELKKD